MKIYKVHFTTDHGLSLFGDIPDILDESKVLGLNIRFIGGGWDKGTVDYYHEWSGVEDPEIMQNFIESQYGPSLIDFSYSEPPEPSEPPESPEPPESGQSG